jgi:eukaryotic-like serine/threonine-protein kinase
MSSVDDEADAVTEYLDPNFVRARRRLGGMLRNKWRLDALLGVGGMAAVYAATHRNGSRAAVKVLHAELSARQDVRGRFMREGYAANAVGHEGAVKVLDDDVADDGSLYLVTELLDGETLEDRRVRLGGRLSEDETLWVAEQVLDVLVAAHAKGIIHRDIKPENVLITRDGELKVLDFGIARLREVTPASHATHAGSTLGTPAYMPPEQARGEEVDARTDLWSVGASMFHALTGRLVHEGRTAHEQLLKAMTSPAPSLLSVLPGVSPVVGQVVDRALAFDKETRWLDARRMQEGVRRAYRDRHGTPITTAPRMTIPATIPNRTLSSAPGMPTTGRPVANSWGVAGSATSRRKLIAITAVGGIVAIGVVSVVVTHVQAPSPARASNGAPSTTALRVANEAGPPTATFDPAPAAPSLPEVAVTDLPIAATDLPIAISAPIAPLPPRPPVSKPTAPTASNLKNAKIDDGF